MTSKGQSKCRVCLVDCNKKILIFEEQHGTRYSDLIKEYIGIELEPRESQPCGLCKECESELMTVIKFISKVRITSEKLNEPLNWNAPLIFANSIKTEDANKSFVSYTVKNEDDDDFFDNINENSHFTACDDNRESDSEAEVSLLELKTKKYSKGNKKISKVPSNSHSVFNIGEELGSSIDGNPPRELDGNVKLDISNTSADLKYFPEDSVDLKHEYNSDSDQTISKKLVRVKSSNSLIDIDSKYMILKKAEHGLTKDMLKCLTCGIVSINRSAFIVHYRKHTGEKPHKCKYCKMKYSQGGTLNAHIKRRHPKEWSKLKARAKKVKKQREFERLKNFTVDVSREELTGEKPRTRVTCDVCGKSYYHKYALNVHMRVHDVNKQIQCPYCPHRFVQTGDRLLHIRVHHTGEKPYCCHICGKAFASGTNLRVHLLSHTEERKFKCEQCGKGMKTKDNLKRHMLVMHTSTKGKVCHICGKAYALTYKLNNHMKIWHMRAGECDICKKNFKNIESHMKTHSPEKCKAEKPFKCHMCHKSFNKQKNLMEHVKKHENEDVAYKCTYENCDYAFAKKCVLDFHVLKYHLKHTPHVCQYCTRGFYRKGDLGQHLKSCHNVKREFGLASDFECVIK